VLIAAVVPGTGLTAMKRVIGIALALCCISLFAVHNYLQIKYR